ncbi:MAG: hypothetical protein KAV00_11630 [Phycisphaerae bacterium]|nr:hypothetical protein [Phycisphaerae bacterium]
MKVRLQKGVQLLYQGKVSHWSCPLAFCVLTSLIFTNVQSQTDSTFIKTATFPSLPNMPLVFTQNNGQCPNSVLYRVKAEGVVPMNNLLKSLKSNQRAGSKPRCHLLTHGTPEQVAERLTKLIAPWGLVAATDNWMPQGFDDVKEAQLHNAQRLLDVSPYGQALQSWWLAVARSNSVTPNWDIASTCTIDGKRGLLLVEAKAHHKELKQDDCCGAKRNYKRIGEAVREANDGLNKVQDGWNLSHESHYQLCNRFAWSWKLATLGTPVVLVYLGFLNADEMGDPFRDVQSWDRAVRNYARDFVPESVWGSKLMLGNAPIYPLIRSMTIQLNSIGGPIDEVDVKGGIEVYQGRP